jgi:hypothetical protein
LKNGKNTTVTLIAGSNLAKCSWSICVLYSLNCTPIFIHVSMVSLQHQQGLSLGRKSQQTESSNLLAQSTNVKVCYKIWSPLQVLPSFSACVFLNTKSLLDSNNNIDRTTHVYYQVNIQLCVLG